jgi:hypothetical protein
MLDLCSVGQEIIALEELRRDAEAKARFWAEKERDAASQCLRWEAAKREVDARIAAYFVNVSNLTYTQEVRDGRNYY